MGAKGVPPLGGGAVASGSIRRGSGRAVLDCGKLLKPEPFAGAFWHVVGGMTGFGWARCTPPVLSETAARSGMEEAWSLEPGAGSGELGV